jgi:ketosteroid isomerase-like protein
MSEQDAEPFIKNLTMNTNEQTIQRFYTAFQKLDAEAMNACYTDDIVFLDPGFGLLRGEEVKAMWRMLCKSAKDFSLEFSGVESDEEYGNANWIARYTFSLTGKRVENRIRAHMRFRDGLICEHTDAFSFYKWSRQAFGIKGWLLGWTNFMQQKVQSGAREKLAKFMGSN